ncbi:PA2778 family cysteine peptidase [Limisalsivibrio acetivorans]|uniref:PA2778 family cysteine peptidase n=1 Tax=Limisalsivibrio acetivorans TaxID=1304888 RepID=UPI0003B65328|nr:PA2778 family cysteine peptidase [Limisalsivibrio acetivorans]
METSSFKAALLCAVFIFLSACTAKVSPVWESEVTSSVSVENVPFYPQEEYQCGPASLAAVLDYSGVDVQLDNLTGAVYTPSRKGSLQTAMLSGARRFGRVPYKIGTPAELRDSLAMGYPVVVLQNNGLRFAPVWHYAVVTGLYPDEKKVRLHSGLEKDLILDEATFEHTWNRGGKWGFILPEPYGIPGFVSTSSYVDSVTAFEKVGGDPAEYYRGAYSEWSDNPLAGMAYANYLYGEGELAHAAEVYENLVEANPDRGVLWNNLANILLETGDYDKALDAAERAVSLGGRFSKQAGQTLNEIKEEVQNGHKEE